MNIKAMFKRGAHELRKNAPHVYTGFALIGLGATIIFAHRAGKEGPKRMEELKAEKENPTKMEVVKAEAPVYGPLILAAGFTAFSILKADIVWSKKYEGLGQLLTASELAYQRLYDKTKEEIGEKRMKKIEHDIHQEQSDKNTVEEHNVVHTGNGDSLFFDPLTNTYFRTNIVKLRQAEINMTQRLRNEMIFSYNDLYQELDLPQLEAVMGEAVGWNAEMWGPCLNVEAIQLFRLDDAVVMPNTGEAATVIDFYRYPSRSYDK